MDNSNYLDQLNQAQRAAVEYLDGPELVIAGAGSGKTRVLTYKIVHLLNNNFDARSIMALTFTNKAAREMRERIEKLVGPALASNLWMGTFHSIFSKILRIHASRLGFNSNYTIYDSSDSKSLIRTIIKEMGLDDKIYRPGAVQTDISNAKNNLCSPQEYLADKDIQRADASAKRPKTGEIYRTYCQRCHIAGAMDFDDLLYYTNVLLRDNPDVLAQLQRRFSYFLVDEYQDTNFAQHAIIRQLAGKQQNLCVVGDDAQSIYSFRGANIRNILNLSKTFPELKIFKLEENYRSTRNILEAANSLIAVNKEQIHKHIFSKKGEGERIQVVQNVNDYEEAYSVANGIQRNRMKYGVKNNDIAILYRTNAQSRVLEEALRNRNIPYRIFGGQAFYQRKEVKDAVSYFRLAINPDDDEALRRIINEPKRSIGDTTMNKVVSAAMDAEVSLFKVCSDPYSYELSVNKSTAQKLVAFADLIFSFHQADKDGMNAAELARKILEDSGLSALYVSDHAPENITRRENILELVKAVDHFVTQGIEQGSENVRLGDFLAEVSLLTDADTQSADGDAVTLMTIHSAKGLEFDIVFIVGVEEDIIPSSMCRNDAMAIEEERRLMYVAITRAKQFCAISFTRQRMVNGQTMPMNPSRFLQDIDSQLLQMSGGASLRGSRYSGTSRFSDFNPSQISEFKAPVQRSVAPTFNPKPRAQAPVSAEGCSTHSADELSIGQRIIHSTYGNGVIVDIDTSREDDRIVAQFTSDGTKRTLLLKYARFKILS